MLSLLDNILKYSMIISSYAKLIGFKTEVKI